MSREVEVAVPDLGNFDEVSVVEVLVKPGDDIEIDTSLITLETEKATMDVPSTVAGIIEKLHISKGGKVNTGDLVATVRTEGAAPAAKPEAPAAAPAAPQPAAEPPAAERKEETAPPRFAESAPAPAAAPAAAQAPAGGPGPAPVNEVGFSRAHAGPSVRKLARELGVDLTTVQGTGFKGRITHDDVKAHVKKILSSIAQGAAGGMGIPPLPRVDFSQFGPVETQPLPRIRRISAARLHASWLNIPRVTQFDEADITDLEQVRNGLKESAAKAGIKLTPLAFIIRACVKALQKFPNFNASLDPSGENLIVKKYMHIGFAADTPHGLLVPVIRDADKKDVYEIARELATLSEKARAGKLSGAEMQGGCFTVSSLGGIGGTAFTPIINPPEIAILGVSKAQMKPVWRDGAFVPRLMLPLSFVYDHRAIDGAEAVRFTTFLAQTLADPRGLLEAVP